MTYLKTTFLSEMETVLDSKNWLGLLDKFANSYTSLGLSNGREFDDDSISNLWGFDQLLEYTKNNTQNVKLAECIFFGDYLLDSDFYCFGKNGVFANESKVFLSSSIEGFLDILSKNEVGKIL